MILVVGATGNLGGLVTRELLARGESVRVLVRDESKAEPLRQAGATLVHGDLKDPASLAAAVKGVQVVVTTANTARRGGDDTIDRVDRAGNANLIDTARAAGVRQFIFVSALGSTTDSPSPFLRAKAATEAHLRASGMTYTIIAPNVFMEVWASAVVGAPALAGRPVVLYGEARRHSFISMRDVVAFIVASIGHERAANQYLPLGGPTPLSWRDIIRAYEAALGHDLPVQFLQPGDPAIGLPDTMRGLVAVFETFDSPIEMAELARTFNVELTPIDTFVREDVSRATSRAAAGNRVGAQHPE